MHQLEGLSGVVKAQHDASERVRAGYILLLQLKQ